MYRFNMRIRPLIGTCFGQGRITGYVFTRNIRMIPKLKKKPTSTGPKTNIALDHDASGHPKMSFDNLMEILPSLPEHQQKLLREALKTQGKDKVKDIFEKQPEFGAQTEAQADQVVDRVDQDESLPLQSESLDLGSGYNTAAELLQSHLQSSDILKNPTKHNKGFWLSVVDFSNMKPGPDDDIPFEFLATLFELAKLQPKPKLRPKYIRLVGDMLYSTKKVRLDPFNEVEYMDALCLSGNYYRAIEIWKSRTDSISDSIYWLEVGSLYYQQARNFANAEATADKSAALYDGYISPRVVMGFINAYSQLKQLDQVDKWYKQLVKLLNEGLDTDHSSGSDERIIEQDEAATIFNRKRLPTASDLEILLKNLLDSRNWEYSALLIDELKLKSVEISLDSTLATLDATTRRMVEYEPAAYNTKRRHIPATESNKSLTILITRLISSYPELLDKPKFYESWLRGLAGLDLYENALMVIDAMVNRGIKINPSHMHTVIKALLAKNQKELAEKLLLKMENPAGSAVYPEVTSSIYALFIQYGARRSDDDYIRNTLERMDARGLEHSQATFNTLMFYYYRHHDYAGVFRLYEHTVSRNGVEFFGQINFRTLWIIFRDYYRTHRVSKQFNDHSAGESDLNVAAGPPDLRAFFSQMIQSRNFQLSLNVYEYAIHTFMLAGDWQAFCAVLCHLEMVNNIKLQSELTTSMLQLAYKLKTNAKFAFARPTKKDLLVSPGYSNPKEPSIPWATVAEKLFMLMEFPEADAMMYINSGKSLCGEWNSGN